MSAPPSDVLVAYPPLPPQLLATVCAWLCKQQDRRPLSERERKFMLMFQNESHPDANRTANGSLEPTRSEVIEALRELGQVTRARRELHASKILKLLQERDRIQRRRRSLDDVISSLFNLTATNTAALNEVEAGTTGWKSTGLNSDPGTPEYFSIIHSTATNGTTEASGLDLKGQEATLKALIHKIEEQRLALVAAVEANRVANIRARLLLVGLSAVRSERRRWEGENSEDDE
ncbi:hypothetical protein QBC39DRAFT_436126 [Podospora conica]|nr:hypothetical protein QBC39DRAFT_436126 [Schizothecium conicum]